MLTPILYNICFVFIKLKAITKTKKNSAVNSKKCHHKPFIDSITSV